MLACLTERGRLQFQKFSAEGCQGKAVNSSAMGRTVFEAYGLEPTAEFPSPIRVTYETGAATEITRDVTQALLGAVSCEFMTPL